jgi:Tfp pilus assembly protein PilV
MVRPPARSLQNREGGFVLIEVLVSALIVVIVTGAVLQLVGSTGKAGAEQRHHSQAYAVAQEDQARLRSMQIASLQQVQEPRTVTLNGTPYEVKSGATFVSATTGATSCGSEGHADYVKVRSEVTWPSMREGAAPAVIESIVSPVSGSTDPTSGNLAVTVKNASGKGISGVNLTGSGPGSFSGSTNPEGCALFGAEPAGKYIVTPTLPSPKFVDFNGRPPSPETVSIIGGTTSQLPLEYDEEGNVKVSFKVRNSGGEIVPSIADTMLATATGLESVRTFTAAGGVPGEVIEAKPLYPFKYPYSFWAGACSTNQLTEGETSAIAPAGGTKEVTLQLPALYLTVKSSTGVPISGANVKTTDTKCAVEKKSVKHEYTTDANGNLITKDARKLAVVGFPSSVYNICASASIASTTRHATLPEVKVESLTGTTQAIVLSSSSASGGCP